MTGFVVHDLAEAAVIEASGRLDALAASDLDVTLKRAAESGQHRLLVDLAGVSYVSSSCLRVLLMGVRRARAGGGDLKLCCLAPRVRQVFALAGFDLVFELWESQVEGAAAFSTTPNGPVITCGSG